MRLALTISLLLTTLALRGSAQGKPAVAVDAAQPSSLIAYEWTVRNSATQIHVMNPDGTAQRRLTSGCCFAWSPDGSAIAFNRSERLYVINRDGTGLRRLVSTLYAFDTPAWSPDGRQIAFAGGRFGSENTAIHVVNSDGSGVARLTTPRTHIQDVAPAWSPDGTKIAFERDNYAEPRGLPLIVMNADGTDQRTLTPKVIDAQTPSWSPDARRITFEGGQWRPNGEIYVTNPDGSAQKNLTRTRSPGDEAPRFAPDGRTIVFQSYTGGPGKFEIHLINADGTRHVNLTRNPAFDRDPSWTPDGRILFVSSRDGNRDVYVMTSAGQGVSNLTNTPTGSGFSARPAWSPTP